MNTAIGWLRLTAKLIIPIMGILYALVSLIVDIPLGWVMFVLMVFILVIWLALGFMDRGSEYDGTMMITVKTDGTKTFGLHLNADPHNLQQRDVIHFKVIQSADNSQEEHGL